MFFIKPRNHAFGNGSMFVKKHEMRQVQGGHLF